MPRISLRAYEKQIEDLIEQNRLQEAIDHCRNILMSYPKCISTYRILGKAFLEGKQYNEAADIFKRVLAVFPDDFIAHVGMSIIRESENNLDAAIWHMELAFDSQPSNITIQEELKRLFGRRDGTHPAKIRLTRGALVRMYARGELYPQAVAEIKSALAEDPKRLDLKVMLAKMYFLLGDSAEALNLCNELITDLPYCYDVNKTMVAILPNTNRSEKTPVYQDRIKALNPYEAFVNEVYLTEADVPDDQVTLDQSDEIAPTTTNANPNWVQTIESKWEEPTNLDALDWLPQTSETASTPPTVNNADSFSAESTKTAESSQNEVPQSASPASESGDDQLPDWMRSAGWLPSEEQGTSSPSSSEPQSSEEPANAEVDGDLPDWLRSLAPNEAEPQAENIEPASEPEIQTPATAAFTVPTEPAENQESSEANTNDELPDWLKNFEVEGSGESESKGDLPEWMNGLQNIEPTANPSDDQKPSEPNPLFKSGLDDEITTETKPDDLTSLQSVQTTHTLDPESAGLTPAEDTLQPASVALPEDWKSNLVNESPAEEETNDHNDSGLPDWVRSVMDKLPNPSEESAEKPEKVDEPIENANEVKPADSVDTTTVSENETEADSPALSEKSGDDLLSWLRDLKPTEDPALQEESEHTGTTGDLPIFEDSSPLDRLQQISGESENKQVEDQIADIQPQETESVPEPAKAEAEAIEPEKQNEAIAEPLESLPPSSLLEHLTQIANKEGPAIHDLDENEGKVTPSEHGLTLSDQLNQLSQQIATGTGIDAVIKNLTELSGKNEDNYLIWQLLGDAYAKMDAFSNALQAYNKAEQLILKPQ
jgi:tetratricopeptide (TPR) repeat protein